MEQFAVVGVVQGDWAGGAVVVHPFRWKSSALIVGDRSVPFQIDPSQHLLVTALKWKAQMSGNPLVKPTDIGRKVGMTPGRVRQILRLNNLHPKIQEVILRLTADEAKEQFPEKMLRRLVPLAEERQLHGLPGLPIRCLISQAGRSCRKRINRFIR